jgi:DNA repair protein RadA/Sms
MPKLNDVAAGKPELIEVASLDWLQGVMPPGLVRGNSCVVAGAPGLGKTVFGTQVAGDLAGNGTNVLYITTEQSLSDIKGIVQRIHANGDGELSPAICDNFHLDGSVADVEALPRLLSEKVLTTGAEYAGTEVIVVDSVQGRGLAPTATSKYRPLYRFIEATKAAGILTFLITHVTKRGQIAGPKDLEHNVDCVIFLRAPLAPIAMRSASRLPDSRRPPNTVRPTVWGRSRLRWTPRRTRLGRWRRGMGGGTIGTGVNL